MDSATANSDTILFLLAGLYGILYSLWGLLKGELKLGGGYFQRKMLSYWLVLGAMLTIAVLMFWEALSRIF